MLLIFLLHLYNNNVNDLCKRAGARHPGPPFSDFRETIHRVAHAGDHHVTSLLLLSCHTGVTFNEAEKSYQSDRLSSEKSFPHFFV